MESAVNEIRSNGALFLWEAAPFQLGNRRLPNLNKKDMRSVPPAPAGVIRTLVDHGPAEFDLDISFKGMIQAEPIERFGR